MAGDAALWCVVPAAGRGSRFGADIPKQYVEVAGKPLLRWTLERLAAHSRIAKAIIFRPTKCSMRPVICGGQACSLGQ